MELMRLGGPVMWPLLLISIAALAVIIERLWATLPYRAPKGLSTQSSPDEAAAAAERAAPLAAFARLIRSSSASPDLIAMEGESIVSFMDRHLKLLGVLAKCATLLGLLGTILGMIETFSVIAGTTGGVDMSLLADGLWQALITTAAGLTIAIPSYIALALFESRSEAMAAFLTLAANICLEGRRRQGATGDASGGASDGAEP